tara:strand:- start:313 stop:1302 length:990 start_codon:yes stop_codon:yes gene_type:complete
MVMEAQKEESDKEKEGSETEAKKLEIQANMFITEYVNKYICTFGAKTTFDTALKTIIRQYKDGIKNFSKNVLSIIFSGNEINIGSDKKFNIDSSDPTKFVLTTGTKGGKIMFKRGGTVKGETTDSDIKETDSDIKDPVSKEEKKENKGKEAEGEEVVKETGEKAEEEEDTTVEPDKAEKVAEVVKETGEKEEGEGKETGEQSEEKETITNVTIKVNEFNNCINYIIENDLIDIIHTAINMYVNDDNKDRNCEFNVPDHIGNGKPIGEWKEEAKPTEEDSRTGGGGKKRRKTRKKHSSMGGKTKRRSYKKRQQTKRRKAKKQTKRKNPKA